MIDMTCKDRSYGARPLRRAIQRYVEDPLSEELIRGRLRGGEIEVYVEGGVLAYRSGGEPAEAVGAGRPLSTRRLNSGRIDGFGYRQLRQHVPGAPSGCSAAV